MALSVVLLLCYLTVTTRTIELEVPCAEYLIVERWNNGWKGHLNIPIPKDTQSWKVEATFDNEILAGDFWAGQKFWSSDHLSVEVLGNDWSARQTAGGVFKTGFTVNYPEHGPVVNFKTLEITLCWADGSGCETCSPLEEAPEDCEGGYSFSSDDGETRTGQLRIMSTRCYDVIPAISVGLSEEVGQVGVSGGNHTAECLGNECTVHSQGGAGINQLIEIHLTLPSGVRVTSIMFRGAQYCDVRPVEVDLSLAPTLAPDPTTGAPSTTEAPGPGCADYRVVERWNNGWKGHLHTPIPQDTLRWRLEVQFNKPVVADFWAGLPEVWNSEGTNAVVLGRDWSAVQRAGTVFKTGFTANHKEGDDVFITWMKLKMCWAAGGCETCDIVKQQCSNPDIKLMTSPPPALSGVYETTTEKCFNDLEPLTLTFSRAVKRLFVARGRYQASCNGAVCVITSVTPIKMSVGTKLRIGFRAVFYGNEKGGKLVGLDIGDEDKCHG